MQNTQLQKVLKCFSKEDLKKIELYLASPYLNKKQTLIKFWNGLVSFAPEFDISEDDKKTIFTEILKTKYSAAYYRNLCSDLLGELLNYLKIETFIQSEVTQDEYLGEALKKFNLLDLLEKLIVSSNKKLQVSEYKYTLQLKDRIWLDDLQRAVSIRRNRTKHESASEVLIDNEINMIIMDYALAKCFLNLNNQHRAAQLLGKKFNYELCEIYFNIYESGLCSNDIYVKAWYLASQISIKNNLQYYHELKKIILEENSIKNSYDVQNLIIAILTFIGKQRDDNQIYWRYELFEIYDFRLKNNLWNIHGELAYTSLYNIVFNALLLDKIEYAKEVVLKYAKETHQDIRNDITNLCNGWIAFFQDNFEEAHQHIIHVQTENIVIKYELRTLQAMIYYEIGDYLILTSYIDSFKHFIQYNKHTVEEEEYISKLKFCNYLIQLVKLKFDPNKKYLEKIKNELNADHFHLKNWIEKKLG